MSFSQIEPRDLEAKGMSFAMIQTQGQILALLSVCYLVENGMTSPGFNFLICKLRVVLEVKGENIFDEFSTVLRTL